MITVNIEKAKEIHKNKLRNARKPILEKLDVDYIRSLEQGLDTTEIVSKKQQLRDITEDPLLLNAQTLEEIKSFWPIILNEGV
jgi:hypothetical protein